MMRRVDILEVGDRVVNLGATCGRCPGLYKVREKEAAVTLRGRVAVWRLVLEPVPDGRRRQCGGGATVEEWTTTGTMLVVPDDGGC